MVNKNAAILANALRKCGSTFECEGCPYVEHGTAKCIQAMQRDAAAMIEAQAAQIRKQCGSQNEHHAVYLGW